jgi:hypothetical protein
MQFYKWSLLSAGHPECSFYKWSLLSAGHHNAVSTSGVYFQLDTLNAVSTSKFHSDLEGSAFICKGQDLPKHAQKTKELCSFQTADATH